MLKKKERLSRTEFNRFFSLGRRSHSPTLMVVSAPHSTFHASAVAPKKVFTTAVLRNKFRRRVYSIMRQQWELHDLKGVFIVIAKAPARGVTYTELEEEIALVIRKIERIV